MRRETKSFFCSAARMTTSSHWKHRSLLAKARRERAGQNDQDKADHEMPSSHREDRGNYPEERAIIWITTKTTGPWRKEDPKKGPKEEDGQ